MHPFSIVTLGVFVAGYITARWDLVTRLYELAIFAWDHGVVVRASASFRRGRPRLTLGLCSTGACCQGLCRPHLVLPGHFHTSATVG